MENVKRISCFLSLLAIMALVYTGMPDLATGEEWPVKDITLIVPSSPGGGYDVLARATAPFIERHLPKKKNVVVKNVIGAEGKIALTETLRAKPDGYNISIVDPIDVAVLQVGGQLKEVDALKLSWLGRLDSLPYLFLVGAKSGLKIPADMKDKAVRFASVSSSQALGTAVVAMVLGAKDRIISYNGTSPAAIAIMQGDIDAFIVNWPSAMRVVRASEGKIIPLFACEKVPELKDIPAAENLGINFEKSVLPLLRYSHILFAPHNLSPETKKIWEETLNRVYQDPEWSAQMNKIGIPPSGGLTGDKLTAIIAEGLGTTQRFKDILVSLGKK